MATGRHGGYRENEFRERETDIGTSRREIGHPKRDYGQFRNEERDYERGRGRGRESVNHRGRNGHRDVRERDNGSYRASSSRGDSKISNGGVKKCDYSSSKVDLEPGEVSNNGYVDIETRVSKENGNKSSPVENKKRKFSPIVWNRDDKEVRKAVKSKSVSETVDLLPVLVTKPEHQSPDFEPVPDSSVQDLVSDAVKVQALEESPLDTEVQADLPEIPAETSSLPREEDEPLVNEVVIDAEYDDYVPARTIVSSRWANDADSPADEGEISDYEDTRKVKRSGSESAGVRSNNSGSPELGEFRRNGSEELVRSSSRHSLHDNIDYMEIEDNHNSNGASYSQSDSESEEDLNSRRTPEPVSIPKKTVNMLQGCRSVNEFERLNKIDEGTYGVVYRAKDKKTGEIVALKKVKMEKEREGFPLTALREMNILLSFDHPSIVNVKEVVVGNNLDSIFMVMEYMEHDLKGIMEAMKQPYSQSEVKCLMLQLLEGTKYLHDNWVLHRDLKTSNVLINNCGELKICDFGLARQYGSPLKPYTQLVVTLWYRAPELLLGGKQYSTAIDMWSLGCIMAELLSKEPLFNGKTELDQLDKIFKILGAPSETIWPGCTKLPLYKVNSAKQQYSQLRKKFPPTSFSGSPVLSDAGYDLLNKLLTYDPEKRITAGAALNHEWFKEVPLPKSKEFMPTFPAQHAQDRRTRRVMKSPDPLEEQRKKEMQGELGSGGLFGQ